MFGDQEKSCIYLYKKDATTHFDALLAADPGIVAETSGIVEETADRDGEWHCVRWCMVVYGDAR